MPSLSLTRPSAPASDARLEQLRAEQRALLLERDQLHVTLAIERDLEVAAALGDASATAHLDVAAAARTRLPQIDARLDVLHRALQRAAGIEARNQAAAELGFADSLHDSYRAGLGRLLALLEVLAVEQRAVDQTWTAIMDAHGAAEVLQRQYKPLGARIDTAVPDAELVLVHFARRWFSGDEASLFTQWRAEACAAGIAPSKLTLNWKG